MSERRVRFSKKAKEDLRLAYRWYVSEDAENAAERLLQEVELVATKLYHYAHAFRVTDRTPRGRELRRIQLDNFPYFLVYTIVDDHTVRVLALQHVRRKASS